MLKEYISASVSYSVIDLLKIIHIKDGLIGKIETNNSHTSSPFGMDGTMK